MNEQNKTAGQAIALVFLLIIIGIINFWEFVVNPNDNTTLDVHAGEVIKLDYECSGDHSTRTMYDITYDDSQIIGLVNGAITTFSEGSELTFTACDEEVEVAKIWSVKDNSDPPYVRLRVHPGFDVYTSKD